MVCGVGGRVAEIFEEPVRDATVPVKGAVGEEAPGVIAQDTAFFGCPEVFDTEAPDSQG